MREIKFRGWDEKNKEMVYNINLLFSNHLNDCFEEYEECGLKIMQYTGLKDKYGKEIYEGDIAIHGDYECFGYVVFSSDELAFAFLVITGSNNKGPTTEFEWLYDYADGLEIIGNIHENPELLEV